MWLLIFPTKGGDRMGKNITKGDCLPIFECEDTPTKELSCFCSDIINNMSIVKWGLYWHEQTNVLYCERQYPGNITFTRWLYDEDEKQRKHNLWVEIWDVTRGLYSTAKKTILYPANLIKVIGEEKYWELYSQSTGGKNK